MQNASARENHPTREKATRGGVAYSRVGCFQKVKIEKFVDGNLSHFRCLACWAVEFNYRLETIEMTISGTF